MPTTDTTLQTLTDPMTDFAARLDASKRFQAEVAELTAAEVHAALADITSRLDHADGNPDGLVMAREHLNEWHSEATHAVTDAPEKPCSVCRESKPLTDFNVNKHAKDGRHALCRSCNAAKARARRAAAKAAALEVTTKECPKCGQAKVLDAFGTDRSRPDGKASRCKECRRSRKPA